MGTPHTSYDTRHSRLSTRVVCPVPGVLNESDLEEHFIRSSGPGGQNVNKVSTCVLLIHHPSGIQVKCQSERSQYLNRMRARELLAQELFRREMTEKARIKGEVEKNRRANRRKPQALKRKILEQKRRHSEKKHSRRTFSGQE